MRSVVMGKGSIRQLLISRIVLSSDGMFGRETNDVVDGVFSLSDGS